MGKYELNPGALTKQLVLYQARRLSELNHIDKENFHQLMTRVNQLAYARVFGRAFTSDFLEIYFPKYVRLLKKGDKKLINEFEVWFRKYLKRWINYHKNLVYWDEMLKK